MIVMAIINMDSNGAHFPSAELQKLLFEHILLTQTTCEQENKSGLTRQPLIYLLLHLDRFIFEHKELISAANCEIQ